MDEKEILEQTGVEETPENLANENSVDVTVDTMKTDTDIDAMIENPEDSLEDKFQVNEDIQDDFVYCDESVEENEDVPVEHKKDLAIQKPIIIACCILLCSIIAFGGFMAYTNFFGKTIIGTWVHESQVEADKATKDDKGNGVSYFTFESDGDAYVTIGTTNISGKWAYNAEEQGKIDIDFSNQFITGTFSITISGNAFEGKSLKLENEYGTYNYTSTTIPPMNPKTEENASIDKKLIGSWENEETGLIFVFNADGTFKYQYDIVDFNGLFSAKDGSFTISYITYETTSTKYSYEVSDGNTILIEGVEFKKVK